MDQNDRAARVRVPGGGRAERLHQRHAQHQPVRGAAERPGRGGPHQPAARHGRVRRRVLLARLAPQRPRVLHRQPALPQAARLESGQSRGRQDVRHGGVRGPAADEAAPVAAALRPGLVGRRAAQGPQGGGGRHQDLQGHQPGGGLVLGVLGQQEADAHHAGRRAARQERHRHLRVRARLRRVRRCLGPGRAHHRLSHRAHRRLQPRCGPQRYREDEADRHDKQRGHRQLEPGEGHGGGPGPPRRAGLQAGHRDPEARGGHGGCQRATARRPAGGELQRLAARPSRVVAAQVLLCDSASSLVKYFFFF